jgi:NADH:ubiquinone oxidoreductase subunit 3 (subunit A)
MVAIILVVVAEAPVLLVMLQPLLSPVMEAQEPHRPYQVHR